MGYFTVSESWQQSRIGDRYRDLQHANKVCGLGVGNALKETATPLGAYYDVHPGGAVGYLEDREGDGLGALFGAKKTLSFLPLPWNPYRRQVLARRAEYARVQQAHRLSLQERENNLVTTLFPEESKDTAPKTLVEKIATYDAEIQAKFENKREKLAAKGQKTSGWRWLKNRSQALGLARAYYDLYPTRGYLVACWLLSVLWTASLVATVVLGGIALNTLLLGISLPEGINTLFSWVLFSPVTTLAVASGCAVLLLLGPVRVLSLLQPWQHDYLAHLRDFVPRRPAKERFYLQTVFAFWQQFWPRVTLLACPNDDVRVPQHRFHLWVKTLVNPLRIVCAVIRTVEFVACVTVDGLSSVLGRWLGGSLAVLLKACLVTLLSLAQGLLEPLIDATEVLPKAVAQVLAVVVYAPLHWVWQQIKKGLVRAVFWAAERPGVLKAFSAEDAPGDYVRKTYKGARGVPLPKAYNAKAEALQARRLSLDTQYDAQKDLHLLLIGGIDNYPNDSKWGNIDLLKKLKALSSERVSNMHMVQCNLRGMEPGTGYAVQYEDLVADVVAHAHALLKQGVPEKNLVLYGHSLGGHLGFSAFCRLRAEGLKVRYYGSRTFYHLAPVVGSIIYNFFTGDRTCKKNLPLRAVTAALEWLVLRPVFWLIDLRDLRSEYKKLSADDRQGIEYSNTHQDGLVYYNASLNTGLKRFRQEEKAKLSGDELVWYKQRARARKTCCDPKVFAHVVAPSNMYAYIDPKADFPTVLSMDRHICNFITGSEMTSGAAPLPEKLPLPSHDEARHQGWGRLMPTGK